MRIYTRIVLDARGDVLEADHYEHAGFVAQCKGGGGGQVPETEAERELARISLEEWNRYVEEFIPLENKFIEDMRATDADFKMAEGEASMATRQAFGGAQDAQHKATVQRGINPASGAYADATADMAKAEGASGAGNVAGAGVAVQDRESSGLMSAIQLGRGQATESVAGMGNIADTSAREAQRAAVDAFNTSAAKKQAWGTAAGAATRYGLEPRGGMTDTQFSDRQAAIAGESDPGDTPFW